MRLMGIYSFFFAVFFAFNVCAQIAVNKNMESYVNRISVQDEKNLNRLTKYLIKPYGSDYEKAMSIAYYLSSRIAFDDYLYKNTHSVKAKIKHRKLKTILKSRSAIGSDFSALFVAMCQKAGIKAYEQRGYILPQNERLSSRNKADKIHVWNYFFYQGKKVYVDCALMSGGRTSFPMFIRGIDTDQGSKENNEIFARNIYSINAFYFDFDYREEEKLYGVRHVEQN